MTAAALALLVGAVLAAACLMACGACRVPSPAYAAQVTRYAAHLAAGIDPLRVRLPPGGWDRNLAAFALEQRIALSVLRPTAFVVIPPA